MSHHAAAGEQIVEYAPQTHSAELVREMCESLPSELAQQVFIHSVQTLGDRLGDQDVYALHKMARCFHNSIEADKDVDKNGMFYDTMWGRKVNPALKVARDEMNQYLKIADQYALTFVSKLRAGILRLAGQSMMQQIHEDMASAIVAQILALDPAETLVVEPVIATATKPKSFKGLRKPELLELALELGAEVSEKPTRKSLIEAIEKL